VPGPRGDELVVNSTTRVDAYDPRTGELLWWAGPLWPPRGASTW
jgi:hypothetical protein